MEEVVVKILPPILVFIIGYLLKYFNVLKKEDGDILLKLVFYLATPALIISSLSSINLDSSLVFLAFCPPLVVLAMFLISSLIGKTFNMERKQLGVFLISTMIMNTGFLIPFVLVLYDQEIVAKFLLLDAVGGIITYSLVYMLATKYGDGKGALSLIKQKILLSPPIWAILIALIINISGFGIPPLMQNLISLTGSLLAPLIMLSLGIYFSLKIIKLPHVVAAVSIRMILGLAVGFILSWMFNFEGLTRTIILLASAAPIGFNTLTFSSLENLDKEFAASIVSVSLLFALFFIPLLILFL